MKSLPYICTKDRKDSTRTENLASCEYYTGGNQALYGMVPGSLLGTSYNNDFTFMYAPLCSTQGSRSSLLMLGLFGGLPRWLAEERYVLSTPLIT